MAATALDRANPTPDCNVVDVRSARPEKPIQLYISMEDLSPRQAFRKGADYVQDPAAYFLEKLGKATFDERKHLLSNSATSALVGYGSGAHMQHLESHIATKFLVRSKSASSLWKFRRD